MATNPWKLNVRSSTDETSEHVEISIECINPSDVAPRFTLTETLTAYRWNAGILGRLAVTLAPDHDVVRRACGCSPYLIDEICCEIHGALTTIAIGDPPVVWVAVPTNLATAWRKLIRDRLAEILAGERWKPSYDDEKSWVIE